MKNALKFITPAWLQRSLRDTYTRVRYVIRFLRFRHAHNRAFGRRIVRATWRRENTPTFITFGEADFALKSLRTRHGTSNESRLSDTPLYEFVQSHVYRVGSKKPYREHLIKRYGYDEKQIAKRIAKFENLIDLYIDEDLPLKAVVKLSSTDRATLVDGAHRATIVHAVGRENRIRCLVVYRTLKGREILPSDSN